MTAGSPQALPRRRFTACVLAAVLLAALVACTPRQERADVLREEVQQALMQGDRATALDAIQSLRDLLPDSAEARLETSRLLVAAGNAPDASWRLEDAVRRYPDQPELRIMLAEVALLLGNPTRARDLVSELDSSSPDQQLGALLVRARAELDLGDQEASLATLREAEARFPSRAESRIARITTLIAEDRNVEARDAVAELLEGLESGRLASESDALEPERLRRALLALQARLELRLGDPERAVARLDALLAEDPSDLATWRVWAETLASEQKTDEALQGLEQALEAESAPAGLFLLAAQLQRRAGLDARARDTLEAYRQREESAVGSVPAVQLALREDDTGAALRILEEGLAHHPESPLLHGLHCEVLLAEGRPDQAREALRRLRDLSFPGDPRVEFLAARITLAEGDAEQAAERLTTLAPRLDDAATHYWLARALETLGDREGAALRYGVAAQRDPTWIPPSAALLRLAAQRRDPGGMVAHARSLLRIEPRNEAAWSLLVEGLVRLDDAKGAEEIARRAVDGFPDASFPDLILAKSLRAQGRTEEALAALEDSRDRLQEPEWETERVLTLGMGGRIQEGLAVARQALERHPDHAQLHAAHAGLLFAAGAAEAGALETDRALALDPEDLQPLRARCLFRAATGSWTAARSDCERYLEGVPDDAELHFVLGVVAEHQKDVDAAIAAYRRSLALDERDPRPRNNLAMLLSDRGELEAALPLAQEAYRLAPDDPNVVDTLAALYLESGLAERARLLLERAHAEAPEAHWVSYRLALAYRMLDRTEEARALLARLDAAEIDDAELVAAVDEALHGI